MKYFKNKYILNIYFIMFYSLMEKKKVFSDMDHLLHFLGCTHCTLVTTVP